MKMFQVSVFSDHEELSQRASKWLLRHISQAVAARGHCLFIPSAGRTPERIYEILRERHRYSVDWSRVSIVQMDEYAGLSNLAPDSFANYIRERLVAPLGIGNFDVLNDENGHIKHDPKELDIIIAEQGGIDVVLYGVGENGHLGFNEPGSHPDSQTRKVQLSHSTRVSNGDNFGHQPGFQVPQDGITLGLKTLFDARKSLVVASGQRKRSALASFVVDAISPDSPVTYLRERAGVSVMLTRECSPYREASCGPQFSIPFPMGLL